MRQDSITTENQLILFSDYIWQDCPYTCRITGAYIVFYQGGPIDHCTHVPGPVYQYGAESKYNEECTTVMALEHLIILNNKFMKKDTYVFPEQAPLFIWYNISAVCMAKYGKYT